MSNKRGFTLIETLIVIGIIVVLSALVFGALGGARERGRRDVCASNLHQFGLAFALYAQDYDSVEPQVGVALRAEQIGLPPATMVFDFQKQYQLNTRALLMCPSAHWPAGMAHSDISSYIWVGFAAGNPSFGVQSAELGPALPLVLCEMHNDNTDFVHQPSWATKWVQSVRYDQRITFDNVNAISSGF